MKKFLMSNSTKTKVLKLQSMSEIFVVTSYSPDAAATKVLHGWSHFETEARRLMEQLALSELRVSKGMKEDQELESPLHDTIPVTDIIAGFTIRYRDDTRRIIQLFSVGKRDVGFILPNRKRYEDVLKVFEIESVKPIEVSESAK